MTATFDEIVDDTYAELVRRGESPNKNDVWAFVNSAWPSNDTAEEVADDWQEAIKRAAEQ